MCNHMGDVWGAFMGEGQRGQCTGHRNASGNLDGYACRRRYGDGDEGTGGWQA